NRSLRSCDLRLAPIDFAEERIAEIRPTNQVSGPVPQRRLHAAAGDEIQPSPLRLLAVRVFAHIDIGLVLNPPSDRGHGLGDPLPSPVPPDRCGVATASLRRRICKAAPDPLERPHGSPLTWPLSGREPVVDLLLTSERRVPAELEPSGILCHRLAQPRAVRGGVGVDDLTTNPVVEAHLDASLHRRAAIRPHGPTVDL